jgi:hypothetical protein
VCSVRSFLIGVGLIAGCAKPRPPLLALDLPCTPARIDSATIGRVRQALADTTHFPEIRALAADPTWVATLRLTLADTARTAELRRLSADTAWVAEARRRMADLKAEALQLPRCPGT